MLNAQYSKGMNFCFQVSNQALTLLRAIVSLATFGGVSGSSRSCISCFDRRIAAPDQLNWEATDPPGLWGFLPQPNLARCQWAKHPPSICQRKGEWVQLAMKKRPLANAKIYIKKIRPGTPVQRCVFSSASHWPPSTNINKPWISKLPNMSFVSMYLGARAFEHLQKLEQTTSKIEKKHHENRLRRRWKKTSQNLWDACPNW